MARTLRRFSQLLVDARPGQFLAADGDNRPVWVTAPSGGIGQWNGSEWTAQTASAIVTPFVSSGITPVFCKVFANVATEVTDLTITGINFDQEQYDSDNLHDNVVNNQRITIPSDGRYLLLGQGSYQQNGDGSRDLGIVKNGDLTIGVANEMNTNAGQSSLVQAHAIVQLVAGDYVGLYAEQSSGITLNTETGAHSTWFAVEKMP